MSAASQASLPSVIPTLETAIWQEAPAPRSDDYLITHYRSRVRTLQDIHQRRSELHIRIEQDGRTHIFHSSIQKVDEDAQLMILHQLQPATWRAVVLAPLMVEVSCFLPSGLMRFSAELAPMADEDNLFCTLLFPAQINKTQQRSSYRVPLLSQNIRAELRTGIGPVFGKAVDFSVDGCCCQFSADLLEVLEEEAAIYQVRFHLGRKLEVISDAVICRIRELPKYRILAGFKFVSMEPVLKRQLQTALLEIERQQLRRNTVTSINE